MGEYESNFDPDEAFERFEIDEGPIHRRRGAYEDTERRAAMERARLLDEKENRAREEQQLQQQQRHALEECQQQARECQATYERRLEADAPLVRGRLRRIMADEVRLHGRASGYPEPLSCGELGMPDSVFAVLHEAVSSRLDALATDDEVLAAVQKMPLVVKIREDMQELELGKHYVALCCDLQSALEDGLYEYSGDLAGNLGNSFTRKLRCYYEATRLKRYDLVRLMDGWTLLFEMALVIEPGGGGSDCDEVGRFADAMEQVLRHFGRSWERLHDDIRRDPRGPPRRHGEALLGNLLDYTRKSMKKRTLGLFKTLRTRIAALRGFTASTAQEGVNARMMRGLTRSVIRGCAWHFADKPDDDTVRSLRRVGFGHAAIDFRREWHHWVMGLLSLSEECLPGLSRQWKEAAWHANLIPKLSTSGRKSYETPGVMF